MAMEGMGGEMGKLSGEMEDDTVTDQNQKDTKPKTDTNTKPEDLDGLQMLRLPPQEDDKTLLRKDILPTPDEPTDQPTLVHQQAAADDDFKHKDDPPSEEPKVEEDADYDEKLDLQIRSSQKHKGVEEAVKKPALVKKEVSELHGLLTERQQKILQDFHVKFVLEGGVNVEEDDDESRARKHSEFVELKKRLEEEEKMYAGCALGEASDITDAVDKDDSSTPADVAVRAAMDGVINSLAEVAICRRDSTSPPQEDVKPQPSRPRNDVRNQAMKGLADDDDDNDELQEYTNREGSVTCQCCCRKAGKQIDEGDESNVYMTHSSYSVLNVVCPVSGMPVVDLEDPVRSEECEHIYDRASALNYIASMAKDGFCLCASPGCRVLLAENKLVTDSRLWQDIEELRQIKAAMWESRMLQDYVNIDDSDDD